MITINFKHIDLKHGQKLLDIGCGEGRHTIEAAGFKKIFCTGADINFKNLLKAKDKLDLNRNFFPLKRFSCAFSAADITELPFEDNSFDIVICSEVMEHIPNENSALAEIKRVLKPKGILALSVPRAWPEKICWSLSYEYSHTKGGHIRIYSKKELIQKLENKGFKIFKHHYAHSIHVPFWWLKCFAEQNRTDSALVNLYHRLLVWDIMKKPLITRFIDKLFNPVMGKSLIVYCTNDHRTNRN